MSGHRFVRALLAALLGCLCMAGSLRATTHLMPSALDATPFIKIEQAFEFVPDSGYIPLRVTITNPYNRARSWVISNQTRRDRQSHYSMQGHTDWRQELSVPAGQMRTFEVLYPVVNRSTWYNDRSFTVQGPGVNEGFSIRGNRDNYRHRGGKRVYALASDQLRLKYGERIPPYVNDHQTSLLSGTGVIHFLPKDWRAYSGTAIIWFQQSDWEKLGADERQPLLQWVAQGGDLRILKDEGVADAAAVGGLPGNGKGLLPYGGGMIRVYPHIGEEELFRYAPATIESIHADPYRDHPPGERTYETYSERTANIYNELYANFWTLPRPLPGIEPKAPESGTIALTDIYKTPEPNPLLVIVAVLIVALIMGPVNLWVFSRGRRRYRLLITTPVLAIILCILIAAVILLSDGVGGRGSYSRLFILTNDNQEVVITTQVSRTGLLLNKDFSLPQGTWLSPPFGPEGLKSIDSNTPYALHGNTYRGNWFGSRRIQEQTLVNVRPSRSGFEIRKEADRLYVVSAFPATCTELYLVGRDGNSYFRATNASTGSPALLEPAGREQFEQWLFNTYHSLGQSTALKVPEIRVRPGHVYASVTGNTAEAPLALQDKIDWQHHRSLVQAPASFTFSETREDAQ